MHSPHRTTAEDMLAAETNDDDTLKTLWKSIQEGKGNDADLRAAIVDHFRPYAKQLAGKHAQRAKLIGIMLDEEILVSAGLYEGVYLHIDAYAPDRGYPLRQYLKIKIGQRMLDELRRQNWAPKSEMQKVKTYRSLEQAFFKRTGRLPRHEQEIRDAYDIEDDQHLLSGIPFNLSIYKSMHEGSGTKRSEGMTNPDDDDMEEMKKQEEAYERILLLCNQCEQLILDRYYRGKNQKEIAAEIGKSETAVSQIRNKALRKLREIFGVPEDIDNEPNDAPRNIAFAKIEEMTEPRKCPKNKMDKIMPT